MEYKLDIKDRKLLYELDLNSRRTLKELGKKVGLTKNSVMYRIENLKKQGTIKNFHTILNVGKLGYISFRLYLELQGVTKEKEKEIIEYLVSQKIITWIVSVEGEYDLALLLLVKEVKELTIFWNKLLEKYLNYMGKRSLAVMNSSHYFSRAYLLGLKQNDYEAEFISEPEKEVLVDEIDLRILEFLAPNADASIIELSQKTKLNPKTIISRIKKMEKNKIILGYKAVLDLASLGYQYYKIHFKLHNLKKEHMSELKSFIFINPNIIYRNEVLGGDDLDIEVQVKSDTELRELIELIKKDFGEIIYDYAVLNYYKEHKFLLMPI
jgi:Lrp/AsnC family leucine-responsive transcriptional regulator